VTEFNVKGEKLYLSPVLDLYSGEIVTYQTWNKMIESHYKVTVRHRAMIAQGLARGNHQRHPLQTTEDG
jgi:hypothetical protein